jgi:hypothetical protein
VNYIILFDSLQISFEEGTRETIRTRCLVAWHGLDDLRHLLLREDITEAIEVTSRERHAIQLKSLFLGGPLLMTTKKYV